MSTFPLIRRFTVGSGVSDDYPTLQSWWLDWGGRNLVMNNEIIIADMAPQTFIASGHLNMVDDYFAGNSITDTSRYYLVRGQYSNTFSGDFNSLPRTGSGTVLTFNPTLAGLSLQDLTGAHQFNMPSGYIYGSQTFPSGSLFNDLDFFGIKCSISYSRFENFSISNCSVPILYNNYSDSGSNSIPILRTGNVYIRGIFCSNQSSGIIIDSVSIGKLSNVSAFPAVGDGPIPLAANLTTFSSIGISVNDSIVRNCMVYDIYAGASGQILGSGEVNGFGYTGTGKTLSIFAAGIVASGNNSIVSNNTIGRCIVDNYITKETGVFPKSNPYPGMGVGFNIPGTSAGELANNYVFQSASGLVNINNGGATPTFTNNATDLTSIPGLHAVISLNSTSTLVASGNLRIVGSGAIATSGIPLNINSSFVPYPFSTASYNGLAEFSWDFEGQPRGGIWSIGADQYLASGATTIYGKNTYVPDGLTLYTVAPFPSAQLPLCMLGGGYPNSGIPMFMYNFAPSGSIPLFISTEDGFPHINKGATLFITTYNWYRLVLESAPWGGFSPINVYNWLQHFTAPTPSGIFDAQEGYFADTPGSSETTGGTDGIPLFLYNQNAIMPEYGEYGVYNPRNLSLGLNLTLLASKQFISNLMSLVVNGSRLTSDDEISLFLQNNVADIDGETTLFISGLSLSGASDSAGLPDFINMPLFMERMPGDSIPLYISGNQLEPISSSITLNMNGILGALSNFSNGDIFSLLLSSYDLKNAKATLYMRGF